MSFLEHTLNWVKGEIFEASMLALWGTALVVMAAFFWRFGHTDTAKALVFPFLVVGLFWGIAGVAGMYVNTQRLDRYSLEYERSAGDFVSQERKRVDGFIWWYRYLLVGWALMILAGLVVFLIWGGNYGRAIGVGLILFGISGLLVDHTSEQNAHRYDVEINIKLHAVDR